MAGQREYMTEPQGPPEESRVADWTGSRSFAYWKRAAGLIEDAYPGIFDPEWQYGGAKYGWSLRYRKSRSFCTFVPERGRFSLLIVFGNEQRDGVEAIRDSLSPETLAGYDAATTYHDGKWLLMAIDSDRAVDDAMKLLAVKRKPRKPRG
jgi:hypothetical protein